MIKKEISTALLFDHFLNKLSSSDKRKDYIFKECRKTSRKKKQMIDSDLLSFQLHYQIADAAWKMAQGKLQETEYSLASLLYLYLQKNREVVSFYKLNVKSFEKLKNIVDTNKHNFRSLKIINTLNECMDVVIAERNYRLSKQKLDTIKH